MTDMITGTRVPNTEAGVQALTRAILKQERDRVRRNDMRAQGDYSTDVNKARRTLEEIDALMTFDWEGIEDRENPSLADRVTAAHTAVQEAENRNSDTNIYTRVIALTATLVDLRDDLAPFAAAMANRAIELDKIINNMQNGESE